MIYTTNSIESLNYQLRKITQEPGPLPLPTRPPSSCCGWRSTSVAGDLQALRTGAPDSGTKRKGYQPTNEKHPADSSREQQPPTGNKPSNSWPWSTRNESTPTCDPNHLHKQLDKFMQACSHQLPHGLIPTLPTVTAYLPRYHRHRSTRSDPQSAAASILPIALFNQNPMSVGYSGRPGESGFPGGCGEYPVGCVISLMCENS